MEEYKRMKRELIHRGKVLEYYNDHMQIPNGNTAVWDYVHHNGAAAVLPAADDGTILMVRQYRNAVDQSILEIPAGCLNEGEDWKTCALRELEEETGFRSEHVEHLLDFHTTPGYSDEKIGIYYATGLIQSHQNLDEDEFVTVERYTLDDLVRFIFNGTITDGKTIAAILAYQTLLKLNS